VRIAVLGTGNVGATLGRRWSACGHDVCFGSRDAGQPRLQPLLKQTGCRACDWPAAVEQADAVLLSVPWKSVFPVLQQIAGVVRNKVLIDCTNPLNASFTGLEMGFTTSAAEQIAERVPDARVVKAFNMVSAATMADPQYGAAPATLFYCGDDAESKAVVHGLAEGIGFSPVDCGPLSHARLLEPLAMLYIHLAFHGWGSHCAFQVVKRSGSFLPTETEDDDC
jgi:8-hydroxy-5-deazaflavin:NADPH oxidoreductase